MTIEQREVYILQSEHHLGESELEKHVARIIGNGTMEEESRRIEVILECIRRIERDLIREQRINEVYQDGVDKKTAETSNLIIKKYKERFERNIRIFQSVEDYEIDEIVGLTLNTSSYVKLLQQLAYCNVRGHNVEIKATENLSRRWVIAEVVLHNVTGLDVDFVMKTRDGATYQIMRKSASEKSILYKGNDHKLEDFYKPNSGFAVAAVTITDQGPQYRFANRDGVPDFFKEIVERRYDEMKLR